MQYREALSSSSMEGTYTTFTDLLVFDAGGSASARTDTKEVHNYLQALRRSGELLGELPVCIRLVRELHAALMDNLDQPGRGASVQPGVLKRHQNFIGGSLSSPRFIPPPPAEALKCLEAMEHYINSNNRPGYELIDAALIHYQFETIHPFPDGNGRVGRILIPVYLRSVGVIDGPYLYMSEYFERNKDEYIDRMYDVSARGAWVEWVRFFLRGVKESCESALTTSAELLRCRDFLRDEIASRRGRSAVLSQVMDLFLSSPVLTIPQISEATGHSDQTVRNNVSWLLEQGLLREANASRPKLFLSPHVLQIISAGRRDGPEVEP